MNNVQIIQPELENFLILEKLTKNEYKSSSDDKTYIIDKKLNKIIFTNVMNSKKKFFYKDDISTVDVLHIILKNFKNSVILERYSTLTEPLSHLTLFQYKNQNFYFYYEIANLYLNNIELFDSTSRQISSFIYNKNHTVIPTISYRYETIDFFVKDNVLEQVTINKDIYNKSFITNRFYQHLSSVIIGKITIGEPLYIKSFTLSNNVIIDVFQEKKYNIMNATQKFIICKRIYKFLEPKWDFSLLLEDTPRLSNTKSYHMFPDNILGMNASEAENLILNTYSSIKEVQIIPQNAVVTTVILDNVIRLFVDDNNIVTDLKTPVNFIPPVQNPPTQIGDTIDLTPPPVQNPPTEIGDTIDLTPPPVQNPPTEIGDTIDLTPTQISDTKFPNNIIGMNASEAENLILNSYPSIKEVQIIPQFAVVTTVILDNVIRLFVDNNNIVRDLEAPVNFTPPIEKPPVQNPPTQIGDTQFPDNILGINASEAENLILNTYSFIKEVQIIPQYSAVTAVILNNVIRLFVDDNNIVKDFEAPPNFNLLIQNPPIQITPPVPVLPSPPDDFTPLPSPPLEFDLSDINITKQQITNIVKSTKKWPVFNLYMKYIRYLNGENDSFSNLSQKQIKALFENKNTITFKNNISQKRRENLTKKANAFFNFITSDNAIYNFFMIEIITEGTKYSHLPYYIVQGYTMTSKNIENDFEEFQKNMKGLKFQFKINDEFRFYVNMLNGQEIIELKKEFKSADFNQSNIHQAMQDPKNGIKRVMDYRRNIYTILVSNFSKAPTQTELNSTKYTIFPEATNERGKRITERKYKNLYYNNKSNLINPVIAVERSIKKSSSFRAAFMFLNIEKGIEASKLVDHASEVLQSLHRLPRTEYEITKRAKYEPLRYSGINHAIYKNRYRNISVFMKKSLYMTQGIRSSFEKSVERYSTETSTIYNNNELIKTEYEEVKKSRLPPVETPVVETGPVGGENVNTGEGEKVETPNENVNTETQKPSAGNNYGKNTNSPIYFEVPENYKFVLTKIEGGKGIYKLFENGKIVPDVPNFDLFHNIINEFEGEFTSDFAKEYNGKNYGNDNNNINFETAQELDVTKIEQELQNEIARSKKFNADTNLNIVKKIPSGLAVHLNKEANSEFVSVNDKDTLTKNTKVKLGKEDYLLNTQEKTLNTLKNNEIEKTLNKYNDNLKKQLCDPDTKLKEFLRSNVQDDIKKDISGKNSIVIKEKINVMIDGEPKSFESKDIVEKMNIDTADTDKIRIVKESVKISGKYSYVNTIDGRNYLTQNITAKEDISRLLHNLDNILGLVEYLEDPVTDKIKNEILNSLNKEFKEKKRLNNVTFYEIRQPNAFQSNGKVKRFETLVKGKNLTFLNKYVLANKGFYKIDTDEIEFVKLAELSDGEISKLIDELKTTQFKFKEVDNFKLVKEKITPNSNETFQNKRNIKELVKFLPEPVNNDNFDELVDKTGEEGFFEDHRDIKESLEKMDNLKAYDVQVLDNRTLYIDETTNTFIGEFEEGDTPKSLLKYANYEKVSEVLPAEVSPNQDTDLNAIVVDEQVDYYKVTNDLELKRFQDETGTGTLIKLDTEYDKLGSIIKNTGTQDTRISENNLVFVDDFKQGQQTRRNALNLNIKTGMATIASKDIDTGTIDDLRQIQYDINSYTTNRNIWETDNNYIVDVKINTKGVIPAVSKISYIFPKEPVLTTNPDGSATAVLVDTFKSKPRLEVTIDHSDQTPLIESFESKGDVTFTTNELHIDYSQYTKNLDYKHVTSNNTYRENIKSVQSSYLSLPDDTQQDVRVDRNFFGDYPISTNDIQQVIDSININFPNSNQPLTMEDVDELYPEGKVGIKPLKDGIIDEQGIKLEMLKNEMNLRLYNLEILHRINSMVDSASTDKLVKLKFNTLNNNAILIGNLEQEELRTQYIRSPTKAYNLFTSLRQDTFTNLEYIDFDPEVYETKNNDLKNKAINTILHKPEFTEYNFYFDNMFESQLIKDSVINVDPDVLFVTQKTFCTVQPYLNQDGTIGYIQNVLDVDPEQLLEDDNMNRNFVIYDEKRTNETGKQTFTTIYKAKDRITGKNVWRELPPEVVEARDRLYLKDMENKRQFSAIDTSMNSFNYNKQQDIINMSQMMKQYEEHKIAFHNSYDNEKSNLLKTTVIIEPDLEDIDNYINKRLQKTRYYFERRKFNRFRKQVENDYDTNLETERNNLTSLNGEDKIKLQEKINRLTQNTLTNINKLTLGLEVEDINPDKFPTLGDTSKDLKEVGKNFYNWFVKEKDLHKSLDDEVVKEHNKKFKNMQLNEWKKDSEYKKLETNRMIKDNLSAREVKKSTHIDIRIEEVFKKVDDNTLLYGNDDINKIVKEAELEIFFDEDVFDGIDIQMDDSTTITEENPSFKELYEKNAGFKHDFFECLEKYVFLDIEEDLYKYLFETDNLFRFLDKDFISDNGWKRLAENDKRFLKDDNTPDYDKIQEIFDSEEPKDMESRTLLRNTAVRNGAFEYRAINVEADTKLDNTLLGFDPVDINEDYQRRTEVTHKLDVYRRLIEEEGYSDKSRGKIEYLLKMTNQQIKPYLGSHHVLNVPDNFELRDRMTKDNTQSKQNITNHVNNLAKRYQVEEEVKKLIADIEKQKLFNGTENMEYVKTKIEGAEGLTKQQKNLFNALEKEKIFSDYNDFVDSVERISNKTMSEHNAESVIRDIEIFKEFINSTFELEELQNAVTVDNDYRENQIKMIRNIIELEKKLNISEKISNTNISGLDTRTAIDTYIDSSGKSWAEIRRLYRELIIDSELRDIGLGLGITQTDSTKELKFIEEIENQERQVRHNNSKYGNLIKDNNVDEIEKTVKKMNDNATLAKTTFNINIVQNEATIGQMENMKIMKENVINFLQKERVRKGKGEIANNNKLIRGVKRAFDILEENPSTEKINDFNKLVNEILKEKFDYYVEKDLFKNQLSNTKLDKNFVSSIEAEQIQSITFEDRIIYDETRIFDSSVDRVNKELLKEFNKYQIIDSTMPRNVAKREKNFFDTFSKTKTVTNTKKILANFNDKGIITGLFNEDISRSYLFKFFALYSVDEDYAKDYLGSIMYEDWSEDRGTKQEKVNDLFDDIKKGIKDANPNPDTDKVNDIDEIKDSFSYLNTKNKEFKESDDIVKLLRVQIEEDVNESKGMIENHNKVFDEKTKDAYIDDNVKFYKNDSLLSLDKNDNFFKYVPPEREEVILRRVNKSGNISWLPFRIDKENPETHIDKDKIVTYREWLKHEKTQDYLQNNGNTVDPPLTKSRQNWGTFYSNASPELREVFNQDFVSLDQFDWSEENGSIKAHYSPKINTKSVFNMFELTFVMNQPQKRQKLKNKYAQYLDNNQIKAKLKVGQPILIEGVYFMKVPSYGAQTLIGDEIVKDQFYMVKITEQQMREANERGVEIDFKNKLELRRNIRKNFNIDLPNEIIDLMEEEFEGIKKFNAFHFYKIEGIVDNLIKKLETEDYEKIYKNKKEGKILPKIVAKEILDEVDVLVKKKNPNFRNGKVPPSLIEDCEEYKKRYNDIKEPNAEKKRRVLKRKFQRDAKIRIKEEQKQAVNKTLITLKDIKIQTADPTKKLDTFSRLADTFQAHRDFTNRKANLRESMTLLLDDYRNDPKNGFTDEQKAKLKLYFNHAMFYNPSSFNEEHVRKEFERNAKSFGITDSKIISNLPIPQDLRVAKKYLTNPYQRGLYQTFYRATHLWNTLSTRTKMVIGGVGTLTALGLGIWGISSWVNQTKREDECNLNNFDPETGAFNRPDTCVPLSIQEMINKCANQSNTDVDATWIYSINLDGKTRHTGDDPQDPELLCTENLDFDNTELLTGKDKCHQFCTLVQEIEPEDPPGNVELGDQTSIPIGEYKITDIEGITGLSFDALVERFGIGNIYTKLILGITEQEYKDLLITVENFQEILREYGSVNAGIPVSILASKYSINKNTIKEELGLGEDEYNNYLMNETDFEETFML